jgi:WD40 repeat protein
VIKVAFRHDSQLLASTSVDQTIKLWNKDGSLLTTLNGYSEGMLGVAFSPDDQTLAATSVDGTVMLWNMPRVLDVKALPSYGCNWLRDYLKTNSQISESDRHLCQ